MNGLELAALLSVFSASICHLDDRRGERVVLLFEGILLLVHFQDILQGTGYLLSETHLMLAGFDVFDLRLRTVLQAVRIHAVEMDVLSDGK